MASTDNTPAIPANRLFALDNKVALITGASRGIGAAIAVGLSEAGAHVILVQRSPATPTITADAIRTAGRSVSLVYADLADKSQSANLFQDALRVLKEETGQERIHILVHAAGIQRRAPAVQFPDEDWDEVIAVNLSSAFLLAKAAGAHMLPHRDGKIILLASLLTFQGGLTVPAYAAAKGGIGQLVKALSNEWSQHNVHVNAIAPGYIQTDMNEGLLKDPVRLRQISERIPAGRWGTPDDFKGPTIFLASQASQYVSGHVLVVDGGWMGR